MTKQKNFERNRTHKPVYRQPSEIDARTADVLLHMNRNKVAGKEPSRDRTHGEVAKKPSSPYFKRRVAAGILAVGLAAGTVGLARESVNAVTADKSAEFRVDPADLQHLTQEEIKAKYDTLIVTDELDTIWDLASNYKATHNVGSASIQHIEDPLVEQNGGTHVEEGDILYLPIHEQLDQQP